MHNIRCMQLKVAHIFNVFKLKYIALSSKLLYNLFVLGDGIMNLEIANKLVELRKEHGFSQEELAEKLNVSRQAVSKWERGESSPDTDNLISLAKIYNISLDELLLNKTVENKKEIIENKEKTLLERVRDFVDDCIPLVIAFVYLMIGVIWKLWHPGWILFLLIPVIPSFFDSLVNKDPGEFAFPVFITAVYLFIGCVFGGFHIWWILFILIPIYDAIADAIKKRL